MEAAYIWCVNGLNWPSQTLSCVNDSKLLSIAFAESPKNVSAEKLPEKVTRLCRALLRRIAISQIHDVERDCYGTSSSTRFRFISFNILHRDYLNIALSAAPTVHWGCWCAHRTATPCCRSVHPRERMYICNVMFVGYAMVAFKLLCKSDYVPQMYVRRAVTHVHGSKCSHLETHLRYLQETTSLSMQTQSRRLRHPNGK